MTRLEAPTYRRFATTDLPLIVVVRRVSNEHSTPSALHVTAAPADRDARRATQETLASTDDNS